MSAQAALLFGSGDTTAGRNRHYRPGFQVWFAVTWWPLIGQPFHKGRRVHGIVGSIALASAKATLPPLGGVASLRLPRRGKPGETQANGSYTRFKDSSHRVAGLAVNCPLLGPTVAQAQPRRWGCFHVGEQLSCTVCTQYSWTAFHQYVHCTVCTTHSKIRGPFQFQIDKKSKFHFPQDFEFLRLIFATLNDC